MDDDTTCECIKVLLAGYKESGRQLFFSSRNDALKSSDYLREQAGKHGYDHATCLAQAAIAFVLTLSASCLLLLVAKHTGVVMVFLTVQTCKKRRSSRRGRDWHLQGLPGSSRRQQGSAGHTWHGTAEPASLPYLNGQHTLPGYNAAQVKRS